MSRKTGPVGDRGRTYLANRRYTSESNSCAGRSLSYDTQSTSESFTSEVSFGAARPLRNLTSACSPQIPRRIEQHVEIRSDVGAELFPHVNREVTVALAKTVLVPIQESRESVFRIIPSCRVVCPLQCFRPMLSLRHRLQKILLAVSSQCAAAILLRQPYAGQK